MLNALIVDDEPPARKRLRKMLKPLEKSGRVRVVAEASDAFEALQCIEGERVDFILLDIQMPEMSGFDLLDRLPPDRRPIIIFTTAYDTYALRAFEENAVDYLLKPIAQHRLEESIARAERMTQKPDGGSLNEERLVRLLDWLDQQAIDAAPHEASTKANYLTQISVTYRDRILILPASDILAVEVQEGITRLIALDEKAGNERIARYVVNFTLEQLESRLDPATFMRVHRSSLIQLRHIREMVPWFSGRYKLLMAGGHEVIASRDRSRLLKQKLML